MIINAFKIQDNPETIHMMFICMYSTVYNEYLTIAAIDYLSFSLLLCRGLEELFYKNYINVNVEKKLKNKHIHSKLNKICSSEAVIVFKNAVCRL